MYALQMVVIDRNDLSRHGLAALLAKTSTPPPIISMFPDVSSAEAYLREHRVQMLLVDDDLAYTQDVETLVARFHDSYLGMNIIVLSNKLNHRYVTRILEHGAHGFIYKQDNLEDNLVPAIKTIREGSLYLSPRAAALFYSRVQSQRVDGLNQSDLSVLHLIAQGYNPQEIAIQLDLSARSIYRIYQRLRQALHVRTSEQIVDAARKRGFLNETK